MKLKNWLMPLLVCAGYDYFAFWLFAPNHDINLSTFFGSMHILMVIVFLGLLALPNIVAIWLAETLNYIDRTPV